jgi:nucleoside-diphosphate-sugar epimerase
MAANAPWLERVAVTGATGFLGGHLARALADRGCRPLLLARTPRETPCLAGLGDKVDWQRMDLADPCGLANILKGERPTTVFHLAGTRGRQAGGSAALACAEVNVLGTVALLEAARQAGVRRVVMVGSADVFGCQEGGPLHEGLPLAPGSVYAASSAAACHFAQALHATEGCPVVILRVFSAYGPYQPADMFVAQAVRAAVEGEPFAMTAGTQRRDLVFVEDVVRALLLAAAAPGIEGRALHIGTGQAHRLRDVAELIWRLSTSSAPLHVGARAASGPESHDTWADIRLARELLNWQPQIDLEDGLLRTIRWAREQRLSGRQACLTV